MPTHPQNRRPTIRDVAREAGVSHQTVSRVLNDYPKVAPETRARVLQVMEAMGYERNLAAQMLTTQRSRTIQIVTLDAEFHLDITQFTQPVKQAGYSAVVTDCTAESLAKTLDEAAARMVDGIMLYAPRSCMPDDKLIALSHGIPLVRRDYAIDSRLTWIGFDQQHATHLAVRHLIDLGHRRIAHITGSLEFINTRLRHDGYVKTMGEHDLESGPVYVGTYGAQRRDMKNGYDGMCELLKRDREFTALLVVNDRNAMGAMRALADHGLRVPDDVSIVGFDDNPIASYLVPPLTTVYFDFDFQAQLGFQYLFEQIRNPETYKHHQHVLIADLVVRQSTRAPA
ncbi:MAG: LacI family DNA-binding transcriptional regulator [Anaerolineae bacterium]|nr:LacI family DNA-binding transcriptional regulator [Anaerolineae bacterium]